MRVAYISDYFYRKEVYGLGRYADELYRYLQDEAGLNLIPCTPYGRARAHMRALKERRYSPLGRKTTLKLWEKYNFPPLEWWVHNLSVVHTLEMSYTVPTRKPWVLTVHDIGPLTHPHFFSGYHGHMLKVLRAAVEKAAALLCVSQATADDVQNYLKLDLGDRLRVIPEGVSERFFQPPVLAAPNAVDSVLPPGTPFFLFTGAGNPRKNLARVMESFNLIAPQVPHHLVMTGKLMWDYDSIVETLERSPHKDRIHRVGHLTDEEVRDLYRRADGYLYLSLMEGFGLPLLEAMASGCPVVTSNISSMPEIAGDAAALVDPYDVEAIAAAMLHLVEDRAYAQELVEKGKARARRFTWSECARRTAQVYREVAG